MSLFRHPYLVRGVVHTAYGSFTVSRGCVEAPEEVGELYNWAPVNDPDDVPISAPARRRSAGRKTSDGTASVR